MKFSETKHFYKLHGAGNDFIILDNRSGDRGEAIFEGADHERIAHICARHTGVGADGFMLISESLRADFSLAYYNADGHPGEMCGNGARCAAWLAFQLGISPENCTFEVWGKIYRANVLDKHRVRLQMRPPTFLKSDAELSSLKSDAFSAMLWLDTGVPHLVIESLAPLDGLDVRQWGKFFREHALFQPTGTNVNFIRRSGDRQLTVRVYERGVENETLACGTGAVACGVFAVKQFGWHSPVTVQSPGGRLNVEFDEALREIFLTGPVCEVFTGCLILDA